jgi:hypothetical protein
MSYHASDPAWLRWALAEACLSAAEQLHHASTDLVHVELVQTVPAGWRVAQACGRVSSQQHLYRDGVVSVTVTAGLGVCRHI